jgi:hypothetical protein
MLSMASRLGLGVDARLPIGRTIPFEGSVSSVILNGAPVDYVVLTTSRGQEVVAEATGAEEHALVVVSE